MGRIQSGFASNCACGDLVFGRRPRSCAIFDLEVSGGRKRFDVHAVSGNAPVGGEPREGADGPGGGHERGGCAEAQYG